MSDQLPSLTVDDISVLTASGDIDFTLPSLSSDCIAIDPSWTIGSSDSIVLSDSYYSGHTIVPPAVNVTSKGIELDKEADINIGGMSLKQTLESITQQLNILVPDPKLEKEYQELKNARAEYDRIREKLEMLEKLKTPLPKNLDKNL